MSVCLSRSFKLLLFCLSMESSHFLVISSPCCTLQNVVIRFWICWHGNEIWSIFPKKWNCFFIFVCRYIYIYVCVELVLRDPLDKTLFFDFWFRPPTQNLLPKIWIKSPISQLVWQIDRRCLSLPGGFRGWPIQWNHAKCCGAAADPCCLCNEIWARCRDPDAYRLVNLMCWCYWLWRVMLCSWKTYWNNVKPSSLPVMSDYSSR